MAQRTLTAIWRDVLGVDEVSTTDDFFQLGWHSLHAMQVASRVADQFGVHLALGTIFNSPTIAGLASHVEQSRPT